MLKANSGKLTVYTSVRILSKKRLDSVKVAAEQAAKRLNLDFEIVCFEEKASPIYVYYREKGEEPIPLYCDEGKISGLDEICRSLSNMMFVLSFHPKCLGLRQIRNELIKLS